MGFISQAPNFIVHLLVSVVNFQLSGVEARRFQVSGFRQKQVSGVRFQVSASSIRCSVLNIPFSTGEKVMA
jgi:hypothetical protein